MTPVSQQRWTGHWIVTRYAIKQPMCAAAGLMGSVHYVTHHTSPPPPPSHCTASRFTITEKLAWRLLPRLHLNTFLTFLGRNQLSASRFRCCYCQLIMNYSCNANLLFSRVEGIVESSGSTQLSVPAQRSQAGCGEVQIKKYEDKAIN